jgi:hypothetical protein
MAAVFQGRKEHIWKVVSEMPPKPKLSKIRMTL